MTRDDLPDGGADHFYRCILAVRKWTGAAVEVLTPDFLGDIGAIDRVLEARPEVYNHNMETVPRLYRKVRGRAGYQRSLDLLEHVKRRAPDTVTKSGLMLGLGEATEELLDTLADLRAVDCDTLTLGQYLAPTLKHIPVSRYLPPQEFDALAELARSLGFKKVASGPFVRSSYNAADVFEEVLVGITEVESSPQGPAVAPQPLTPEAADSANSEVAERAVDEPEADVRRTGLAPEEGLDLGERDPANPHGGPMPQASAGAELSALGSVGFFARLWGMVRGLGQRESRRSDN